MKEKTDALDRLEDFRNARSKHTKIAIRNSLRFNPFVKDISANGDLELILNADAMDPLLDEYKEKYPVDIKDSPKTD